MTSKPVSRCASTCFPDNFHSFPSSDYGNAAHLHPPATDEHLDGASLQSSLLARHTRDHTQTLGHPSDHVHTPYAHTDRDMVVIKLFVFSHLPTYSFKDLLRDLAYS